ncbi:MAG: LuxR C-terminal-related transcriptional regulator [Colwellia sp.]|jgi:DNA-binding NarL/FixJ family response regulator|uniref:helix-turn-helix transcriptional regulator n=1 Tax=Colwellia sp. Bg11-12 TaxID=2759817 RepID=UPI0015F48345|nr:LuxR C-terminal-related transcriptional regulator [Colwellia sp. Bg11-12]MBA6265610.1 LuxR family transcriptional regulator [Colwellia sp. Bg11-12]
MKDRIIASVLLIIMVLNFFDVLTDISLGVPMWHVFEESMIVLISGIAGVFLILEIKKRTHNERLLKNKLNASTDELNNITEEMTLARRQYSQVIHDQFELWQLTQSEQNVAMLLLKGLSFKEISAVRETKEKTVRQQASTIYNKSGVEGRHDFAAWFLEDFIT